MPLATSYDELRQHAGRKLGYSGDLTAIDADDEQSDDVDKAVASGLRKVYTCARAPRGNKPPEPPHVWSFLKRELTLSIVSGQWVVELPEDFRVMLGNLVYSEGDEIPAIAMVDESQIRSLRAGSSQTGPPQYAAVRAREVITGERYELILYPTPAADYTVTGRYFKEPPKVDSDHQTPAGASLHSETMIAAVLCACDEQLNSELGESLHCQRFADLLESSIALDAQIEGTKDSSAWPVDEPEGDGSLCVNRRYLDRLIGLEVGFGPNSASWTHGQRVEIARLRTRALRRVYVPASLDGKTTHKWSFLSPRISVTTITDNPVVEIPRNVTSILGPLVAPIGDCEIYDPIPVVGEIDVERKLAKNANPARPQMAAIRPRPPIQGVSVGQELVFYPIPDAEYTFSFRCRINPYDLPNDDSEPPKCVELAEVIIASAKVLAAEFAGRPSPALQKQYEEALAAAILADADSQSVSGLGVHSTWEGEPDAPRIREFEDGIYFNRSATWEG